MSYAGFEYSDIKISDGGGASSSNSNTASSTTVSPGDGSHPSHPVATVSLTLNNHATVAGAKVVQLYLGFPATAVEPPKQLKGFKKLTIPAGGAVAVSISLTEKYLMIWSVATHRWAPVKGGGTFKVMVGSSSRDIRLVGEIRRCNKVKIDSNRIRDTTPSPRPPGSASRWRAK